MKSGSGVSFFSEFNQALKRIEELEREIKRLREVSK